MRNQLKGTYTQPRLYHRSPHERALHLRWVDADLIEKIHQAAKQHNRSTVDFVVGVLKRYLAGNSADQPIALCPVCKRRASSPSPLAHAAPGHEVNVKQKEKPSAKPEADVEATTCRHRLQRHPSCLNSNGQHAHGDWWKREECNDPACAKRTQGWKLAEINAAKRLGP